MSPPLYCDLGKQNRDIFSKGFHFGLVRLDLKTRTASGVQFNSGGHTHHETGKAVGSIEGKYILKDYNTTVSTKWNTTNVISSKFELQNLIANGLKITMDTSLQLANNLKNGKVGAEYKNDLLAVAGDVDLNLSGPLVNGSAVLGHGAWLAGAEMSYDTSKAKLTRNNVSLGVAGQGFSLIANMNDGQIFGGSFFHKLNPDLELGMTLGWAASVKTTNLACAAKYKLDSDASVKAKFNNSRQLGLCYQQKLSQGISVALSSLIDTTNLNQGGHKVGFSVELEA